LPDGPERNAFDLSATDIAIIGNGNVAVDVARILLRKPEQLEKTDISESAMESLKLTTIRRVSLIGRRGPVQAAYTTGELRELLGLEGVVKRVPDVGLVLTGADEEELKQRALARKFDLLKKILTSPLPKPDQSVLQFYFLRSPVEFIEDPKRPGHVGSIKFQHNMLVGPAHSQSARGTEYHSEMPAQLVFTSIGYSSKPMPGLPFDDKRGIIPNDKGKVEDGVYVCGWIKRGPTGIIGTNKFDAQEVIATIVADQQALSTVQTTQTTLSGIPLSQDFSPLSQIEQLLSKRNVDPVRFSDWEILDKEELTRGEARSKLREKFKKSKEMLQFLEDRSTL
jgi:adrenodoxin-NADP+ reductase